MNKPRVRVSIVIPAHNEERHLWACLEAIAAQTQAVYEVIVVDNNSTDQTRQIAASFPFVTVVHEAKQGIVYARNTGFDAATGDIIGRIDADIVLPTDWVAHIQAFYADEGHAQTAWSGGAQFYNVRLPRLVGFAYGLFAFHMNKILVGHYALWGSNMAVTRAQWQAVRSHVCHRTDIHEDLDLAMHLSDRGYRIRYERKVKASAELRRVYSDRHTLWKYLEWWPRTLKSHNKRTWLICWLLGVFLLYHATAILVGIDKFMRLLKRQAGAALETR
jgi:glycosyltransferase involved in cell wall biosynthesis